MEKTNLDYSAILVLPFGKVGLKFAGANLAGVDFLDDTAEPKEPENTAAITAASALKHYAETPCAELVAPLETHGTQFQERVWHALTKIPSGNTITYSELAQQLGTGARAVGNACRNNPIPLFIPCHRVVAKNGIGGYAGDRQAGWTRIKTWLLQHEQL